MRTKTKLLFTLPFFLCACQSMESFLSDSGVRQDTSSAVVVNKVPRHAVNDSNASQVPAAPSAVSEPSSKTQAATTSTTGQGVVPNVAPSLGE